MFTEVFQQLGLAKNEARIYQTLLKESELAVGELANKSGVHRRNVYDSLNRLVEKGLVFEILQKNEQHYKAVEPNKLFEILEEKQQSLAAIMPDLERLYQSVPHEDETYVYRGIEGWKNYMRDVLRVGEDLYTIGGKGAWTDERLKGFLAQFLKEIERKEITIRTLFDHEVKESDHKIVGLLGKQYRFLGPEYSTPAAVDIFGNHVAILSGIGLGRIADDTSFTMIVNKEIADAFRTWFKLLWSASSAK
jgi:sugar-specific transcriptional regulator TrmB